MVIVRSLLAAAAATVAGAAPSRAHGADLVFAQDFLTGSKQVVSYPVGNPASMTIVGPLADTLVGMDFNPAANVLWAVNFATHALGTVDQASGAFAPVKVLADSGISAFTVDPVDGAFYVSKADEYVYRLDPASGETTLLGAGAVSGEIRALAADCSGRLFAFALASGDSFLYRTPLDFSASPTLIGPAHYAGATTLEFDNTSATLYAWFNATGDAVSTHGTVDPLTAAVTQTSVLSGRYRMAVRSTCSIFADDFEA